VRALTAVLAMVLLQPSFAPSFELIQPGLFSATGGQANAWADADNDGDLDYFVAFRGRPNRFYRNDNGTFRDVAKEVGLFDDQETRAVAWAISTAMATRIFTSASTIPGLRRRSIATTPTARDS
jgi:hypothetical protein